MCPIHGYLSVCICCVQLQGLFLEEGHVLPLLCNLAGRIPARLDGLVRDVVAEQMVQVAGVVVVSIDRVETAWLQIRLGIIPRVTAVFPGRLLHHGDILLRVGVLDVEIFFAL